MYGNPPTPMEFELDDGPAIEALLHAYPDGFTVADLPHPSEELEDKVGVAQALYKEGFLAIMDEMSKPATGGTSKKGKKSKSGGKAEVETDMDPLTSAHTDKKKKKKTKDSATAPLPFDDDIF